MRILRKSPPARIRHEYIGPDGKPEVFVFEQPSIPVYIRVRAQQESLDWKYHTTELGRRFSETIDERQREAEANGGEYTMSDEEAEAILAAGSEEDLALFRRRALVGVAELLDHLQAVERDGPTPEDLMRWVMSNPVRSRAVEVAKNRIFNDDDSGRPEADEEA